MAAFPVQIQPIASDAGRLGDLILSQDGLSGEKHFVSTKRNSSLNDEFIEFEITGIPQAVFDEFLEWEGGVAGDTSLRRKVSREQAAKTQLKVKVSSSSTVVDMLNVWTVWVNISGSVGSVAPQNVSTPLPGGAGNGQIGEQVKAVYTSVNAIQPASIITGSDIPNLSGENATVPPGGQSIDGEPLSGGASTKWDMSRRLQRTITLGGDIAAGAMPGGSLDQNTSFPDNPIVGNDDAYGSPNPATDPYSNGGNLQSLDTPTRTLTFVGGNAGATYLNVSSFQEFARLEINGKWYLISDVDPWTVNFRFSKIEVNEAFWNFDANQDGDTADAISEQQVNQDLNRNGSSSDNLSIWINNNSDTQN